MPSRDQQGTSNTSIAAGMTPEVIVESIQRLLDGFSIEARDAPGKLEAKVATNVCKQNGRLKGRLEIMSTTNSFSQDEHGMSSREIDPVSQNDPSLNAGSGGQSNPSYTQLTCDYSFESAWS